MADNKTFPASAEADLYSFDLFDTLVTRPLHNPVGVFSLVQSSSIPHYRWSLFSLLGFRRWRRWAELFARRRTTSQEITLREIYALLGLVLRNAADVMRLEVRVELALLRPVPENISALTEAQAAGKACCVTSDMYLPDGVVRRIVRRHVGDIPVHVSSTHGATKASGELFRVVSESHGVALERIRHHGDNSWSDFRMPLSLGMSAIQLRSLEFPSRARSLFSHFSHQRQFASAPLSALGYSLVGPACIAFACCIKAGMVARGIERVFFGARDTYLVKRAFDLLFPGTPSEYVRLSRRALYVPEIAETGCYERLFEGRLSAQAFFARVGLETPAHLRDQCPHVHREAFLAALHEQGFVDVARTDSAVLRGYLGSRGFHGKVAYVDLGWRGSLQDSLARIFGASCDIHGFYFGTTVSGSGKHGCYFENKRPFHRYLNVFQALPAFEFLFTEPVESLKRIRRRDDDFEFEFVDDESPAQIESRRQIEAGCERFFADYLPTHHLLAPSPEAMKHSLDQLIRTHLLDPEKATIDAFAVMSHSVGFGGSDQIAVVDSRPATLQGYIDATWRGAYVNALEGPRSALAKRLHRLACSRPGSFATFVLRSVVRQLRRVRHAVKGLKSEA